MFKKGEFYHVYNRSIKERLFYNTANYQFFLKQYGNYLSNFVNTYAYCLIPQLNREELHNLFNSKKTFINFHNQNAKADFEKIEDVILE